MDQDSLFKNLYHQHHPALLQYAVYFTRSKEDALEIVNDVFVALWNKRKSIEWGGQVKAYLYATTKNHCINWLRKRKMSFAELLEHDAATDRQADTNLHIKEQVQSLNDILDSLPLRCKQVFLMSRLEGFSYREIAELMGISVKTVENQMAKALKTFKENLPPA